MSDIYLTTRLRETRDLIESVDRDILASVRYRARLVRTAQQVKERMGLPVYDELRETHLNRTLGRLAGDGLTEEQVVELFTHIRELTMPELKART